MTLPTRLLTSRSVAHLADYDHLTPFPKQSVVLDVDNAGAAITKLTHASDQQRETFFTLLAFKSGLR